MNWELGIGNCENEAQRQEAEVLFLKLIAVC